MTIILADSAAGSQNQPPAPVAYNTGASVGDVLVCTVFSNSGNSPGTITISDNVNSGPWTLLNGQLDAVNTLTGLYIFFKVANAAGTPTVSCSETSAQYGTLYVERFTGFVGTPTADSSITAKFVGTNTTAVSCSPIVTNFDNELLLGATYTGFAYFSGSIPGWSVSSLWNGIGPPWYAPIGTSGTSDDFVGTLNSAKSWQAVFGGIYSSSGGGGNAAPIEADDTAIAQGGITVSAAGAITETHDAIAASGVLTFSGAAALTEPQDAIAAVGGLSLAGVVAILESPDIASGAAAAGSALSGDIMEGADSVVVSGALSVAAGATITEQPNTAAAQGSLSITGFAAIIEAPDGIIASAVAGNAGSAAIHESADAVSITGTLSISASVSIVESSDVPQAGGALSLSAFAAILESPDIAVASRQTSISASVAVTESSDVAAAIAYFGTPIKVGVIPLAILANQSSVAIGQNSGSLAVLGN